MPLRPTLREWMRMYRLSRYDMLEFDLGKVRFESYARSFPELSF